MKFLLFVFLGIISLSIISCSHKPQNKSDLPAYDAELNNFDYPFAVKLFETTAQDQTFKMAYMDIIPKKQNGKTVVLLHGKNFSGYYWKSTIDFLSEAGFRVVVPDQIGFGKSSKPKSYQFSFQSLAENTKNLLAELKISKPIIIGHSMGGMLAVRYALMYPELVDRLVLVNPIGLEDWKAKVPYKGINDLYAQELEATPESIKAYQQQVYFAGEWKPEYDPLVDVLSGWTRHEDYPKVAWNSALTAEMIFTQPIVYEFPLLKVKTLLIIGTRDRTAIGKAWASKEVAETLGDYSKLGKSAAKAIPKSQLVEIPNVGHVPQIEAFDTYKKSILDFAK